MDTISRENNSMLPAIGVAIGAVAFLLAAYSAISLSKIKAQVSTHEEKLSRLDDIASQASAASSKADSLRNDLTKFAGEANTAFATVSTTIGTLEKKVDDLEVARKPAAVAGPGEYVVKPGDSLAKIARANGVSLADLESVNPGVSSAHLKIGQKLKLPQKGAAVPAAAPAAP